MENVKDTLVELNGLSLIYQKIPSYQTGRHSHPEHEFFLPVQGEIEISYKEKTVKASPGKMLYVPPDIEHDFISKSKGSGERLILLIKSDLWKTSVQESFAVSSMPVNNLVKELAYYLLTHKQQQNSHFFISSLIEIIAEDLQTSKSTPYLNNNSILSRKTNESRIKKAIELIDENLSDISLSEVARQSGMSPRNFNRLFQMELGTTPKNYLILKRVRLAENLLKKSKKTITDISLEVGYSSVSKFIEIFKRHIGKLPSDYRESLKLGNRK